MFAREGGESRFCPLVEHRIDNGEARPFKTPLRRFSSWQEAVIAAQMNDLLNQGVICPAKVNGPLTLLWLKKKCNKYRMVVDSRPLNRVTVNDTYCTGNIQSILDSLHGINGLLLLIYHIPIASSDRQNRTYRSFRTKVLGGLSQFNRMCFGVTSPATFCRLVD